MEPNDTGSDKYHQPAWRSHHGLIPGVIVIGIGVLFLLQNFHIMYIWDWWRYWPVAVIAAGLVKLVDSTYGSGRVVGGITVGIGAIFLGSTLGLFEVTIGELWPLFLIGAGLMMLGNRVWGPHLPGQDKGGWNKGRWDKGTWEKGPGRKGGKPKPPDPIRL